MTMLFPWFEFWVWLLSAATAFAGIVAYGIATIRYRLGDEALEILVLGVPFRAVPYAGIEAVEPGGSLLHEHWVTFRLTRLVTLRLRDGKRRAVVISPPDPQGFVRNLEARMIRQGVKDTKKSNSSQTSTTGHG